MKSGNLLLGLLACAAMCACTNDDAIENGGGSSQVFTSDVAYMVVNIKDVGSTGTRAEDGGFLVGTEHDVKDIHFYFYDDEDRLLTSKSTQWNDGTEAANETENVEFEGYRVVTLTGLTGTDYPSCMVTILNQPDDFTPGTNLDDMESALASATETGIYRSSSETDYFTMSTSSYDSGTEHYFVTPVDEGNFSLEPIVYNDNNEPTNCTPVEIYVERLAAKVELINGLGETDATTIDNVEGIVYKLTQDLSTEGSDDTASTDLYIKLNAWGLNATETQSYMMKNIDTTWSTNYPGFEWNDSSNHRSYWGMSVHYGLDPGTYPTSSQYITSSNNYLNYINAKQITNTVGSGNYDYCAENTNTAGEEAGKVIGNKNSSAITSILLKATVYDGEGNSLDLVRCAEHLYTKKSYLAFALTFLENQAGGSIYDKTSETTYSEIDTTYIGLTEDGLYDGNVKVSLKKDPTSETFFVGNNNAELTTDELKSFIDNFNDMYGTDANGYNGGLMYYNIPIEHLNDPAGEPIQEGMYGVVRNHYYRVTINKLENLGRGIFNPDEKIIPVLDVPTYYIGAQINILSWKLVNQSTDL